MMTQKRELGMTNIGLHGIQKQLADRVFQKWNGRSCALKQGLQLHTIWKITTNGYPGCSKYNASCGCHLMIYRRTMQVWRRYKREAKRKGTIRCDQYYWKICHGSTQLVSRNEKINQRNPFSIPGKEK